MTFHTYVFMLTTSGFLIPLLGLLRPLSVSQLGRCFTPLVFLISAIVAMSYQTWLVPHGTNSYGLTLLICYSTVFGSLAILLAEFVFTGSYQRMMLNGLTLICGFGLLAGVPSVLNLALGLFGLVQASPQTYSIVISVVLLFVFLHLFSAAILYMFPDFNNKGSSMYFDVFVFAVFNPAHILYWGLRYGVIVVSIYLYVRNGLIFCSEELLEVVLGINTGEIVSPPLPDVGRYVNGSLIANQVTPDEIRNMIMSPYIPGTTDGVTLLADTTGFVNAHTPLSPVGPLAPPAPVINDAPMAPPAPVTNATVANPLSLSITVVPHSIDLIVYAGIETPSTASSFGSGSGSMPHTGITDLSFSSPLRIPAGLDSLSPAMPTEPTTTPVTAPVSAIIPPLTGTDQSESANVVNSSPSAYAGYSQEPRHVNVVGLQLARGWAFTWHCSQSDVD